MESGGGGHVLVAVIAGIVVAPETRHGHQPSLMRRCFLLNGLVKGDDACVTGLPKFTNIYAKRGISVNLPQLFEVGFPGMKAGLGINRFKEPVAQQLRA